MGEKDKHSGEQQNRHIEYDAKDQLHRLRAFAGEMKQDGAVCE